MAKAKKEPRLHDQLLEALAGVDRPGDFCTWGDRPLTLLGLEVPGLGPIGLPLTKTQARELIKVCRQAPFGKGTETVVDTSVRRSWTLEPDEFRLTNPKWGDLVAAIVNDVQEALGLQGHKLSAELYELLLYEKGGFFLPHRDGEKLDRMVATLAIVLPSVHEGGELIVSHAGQRHEITFPGAASGHELSYAAFYADCQHEVWPVKSGFRLILTYNLTLAGKRGKTRIAAPSYGEIAAAVGDLLGKWGRTGSAQKLAVTLDHRYSQAGLSINTLKGVDRARAEVLFEAADGADCVAHLALVTLQQSGSAEGGYGDYSYGRGRGYHWSDEEDDENYDETGTDYEMGEIFESSLSAEQWSDRHGKKVRLGTIHLDEDEIVADTALDDAEPSQEDFEGYTGNAGMTLERWYHRAAVVVWPRSRHFQVLTGAGTEASIGGLEAMVRRLKRVKKADRDALRRECLSFASAIIDSWNVQGGGYWRQKPEGVDRSVFAELLFHLDDPKLVRRFLVKVMPGDAAIQLDRSFVEFCTRHGWASFEGELTKLLGAATAATIARNAAILRTLCVQRDKNAERIEVCRRLSERSAKALEAFDGERHDDQWRYEKVDRGAVLGSLVAAMMAVGAEEALSRLLDHAFASDKYDLTDAHLAAIFALERQLAKRSAKGAISRWIGACRRELERRTAQAPQKPADYRRAAKLSCTCRDCRALSEFLADPDRREARFPMAKERRGHLHNIINGNGCDCTHVTQRRGNPHTLVCTKTTASYDAACKIHQRDVKNLSRIAALERRR
ncbi:MAG: 2OG-Fe(II) oxygenase family protein [Thermoguttaceae bacterium]